MEIPDYSQNKIKKMTPVIFKGINISDGKNDVRKGN